MPPPTDEPADATQDAELQAIAAGQVQVFEAWLAVAEPRLRASILSFAAHVDVESVVQEILFRAWSVASRLDSHPEGDTLIRWAVRAARNLAIDETRRQSGRKMELGVPETEVLPAMPDPFLREVILECIERLPRQPRRALNARLESRGLVDDSSVAGTVSMRPNTFLQNVTRARRLVHDCLQGHGIAVPGVSTGGAR